MKIEISEMIDSKFYSKKLPFVNYLNFINDVNGKFSTIVTENKISLTVN